MKFVCIATKGASDPTLASLPFHLAVNGAVDAGYDAAVILAGDAADVVLGETAQSLEGVGVPPLRDLLAKAKEHEVPVYV